MFKARNVINRAQVVTAGVNSATRHLRCDRGESVPKQASASILARSRRLRHFNDVRWPELQRRLNANEHAERFVH
jgi:hypothetical protein